MTVRAEPVSKHLVWVEISFEQDQHELILAINQPEGNLIAKETLWVNDWRCCKKVKI